MSAPTASAPLEVGVTGGIGSGKSLVCRVFSVLKAPVYYADDRARWLLAHDPTLRRAVTDAFGAESYLPDGAPNRPYLAQTVFADPGKLSTLNHLVHPRVGDDYAAWVKEQRTPYVLKEAALLYETGADRGLDRILTVYAPVALRLKRTLRRDTHRDEAQVRAIMARQMDDEEKCRRADFVVTNDGQQPVIDQVWDLHQTLLTLAR